MCFFVLWLIMRTQELLQPKEEKGTAQDHHDRVIVLDYCTSTAVEAEARLLSCVSLPTRHAVK